MKEARPEKEKVNTKMEEKEDEVKPIDWESSGFYIPLPSEERSAGRTTARAAAEHHSAARAERSPHSSN